MQTLINSSVRVASGADSWPPEEEFRMREVSTRLVDWEVSASHVLNMFVIIYYLLIDLCSNDYCVICNSSLQFCYFQVISMTPARSHCWRLLFCRVRVVIAATMCLGIISPRINCCRRISKSRQRGQVPPFMSIEESSNPRILKARS